MDRVVAKRCSLFLSLLGSLVLLRCVPGNSPAPNPGGGQPQVPPPASIGLELTPLWEQATIAGSQEWSQFSYKTIADSGADLIDGSGDTTNFCPAYFSLAANQKISFWVFLVSAIVRYESNFDPTSRYEETTLGIDPITGDTVMSEGLLQLSYQDSQNYPFCNQFDWNRDKNLAADDPGKTILDPKRNLACGIRILNEQVARTGLIAFDRGNYWSTLMPNGNYSRVARIQALTKQISFCNR